MVLRPGTLVKSRGNSPNRPTVRSGNNTTPNKRSNQNPIKASPIRASPARTPPDVEFIIRNSSKRCNVKRTPSGTGSRGSSPAKSESSLIPRSRGSEWVLKTFINKTKMHLLHYIQIVFFPKCSSDWFWRHKRNRQSLTIKEARYRQWRRIFFNPNRISLRLIYIILLIKIESSLTWRRDFALDLYSQQAKTFWPIV